MKEYVAGFMFDQSLQNVLLVEKQKPDWQKGRWNGIGGKIELDETPLQAMQREFLEETSIDYPYWERLCSLSGDGWIVHFFFCVVMYSGLEKAKTVTQERILIRPSNYHSAMLPNLEWLIPMAKSLSRKVDRAFCFEINEVYDCLNATSLV